MIGTTSANGTLTANQRFDAWGNRTAATGTVPAYGYTGREPDATGMVYYRARYYHPGIARFASRDPMGMVDSVSPYAYVANNPINLADPFGMEAALAGTTMNPAYWGMLADASFYTGTQTDVRGGGNGGTFTPGQQRMPSITGSQALDALQLGLDVAGLTEPFGFAADLLNAGISYGRGDALGGSLSLGAAVPVIGAAATVGKLGAKEAGIVANGIRGRASEARVLQELGLTKNTTAVSTAEGRSIPDALTNALSVEVKDATNVSLTRQLQIQTGAAKASGRESILITGENTCVSGPCAKAFDQVIRRPDLGPR